jgi:hypothetical protein
VESGNASNHRLLSRQFPEAGAQRPWLGSPAQGGHRLRCCRGFRIVEEFVEVETGKGADALNRRRKLKSALKAAKKAKISVCVAKLDRLPATLRSFRA